MGVTQARNTESRERNAEGYFIDYALFDEVMNARGIHTATARANKVKISRSTYYRVIKHEVGATLPVAMRFAKAAKTTVNRLFHANGNPTPPPSPGPGNPTPAPKPKAGE